MKFIERRNLIKPEHTKFTSYIQAFNIECRNHRSFFLKADDWDDFSDYMAEKKPDILLVLEYEPLRDGE